MSGTKVYGLLGNPVRQSLSPLMHNAAFRHLDIPAEYRLFEIETSELEEVLFADVQLRDIEGRTYAAQQVSGFNITIPYKVKARELLEERYPSSREGVERQDAYYVKLSGAVNTVKRESGQIQYFNTDAGGFLESLEKDLRFDPRGKSVLLIGCGGAGRAVIAALSWKNVAVKTLYVYDISQQALEKAQQYFSQLPQYTHIKGLIRFISAAEVAACIKQSQLLVNASSTGMHDDDLSVIEKTLLHKGLSVYDVVYSKKGKTQLLKDCESRGIPATSGLSMLLFQGVRAFEHWTGQRAPVDIMRRALLRGEQ